MIVDIRSLLEQYSKITILSHINPDADTIGTALGIYTILKSEGFQVEVVSQDKEEIPLYLDFLPNFSKIKKRRSFEGGLVITCDCGDRDRLGESLMEGDVILNIDHHHSNTYYGDYNIVMPHYAAAAQVAFETFKSQFSMSREAATCFYTGLVSDTQYFSTNSVTKEVFDVASDMIAYDINLSEVAYHMNQRRSLSSLRILSRALSTLNLHFEGRLATVVVTKELIQASGAHYRDMMDIVDHLIALATVKISIVIMELDDYKKISIRSKGLDVASLAVAFGGGGHQQASGFIQDKHLDSEELVERLMIKIKEMGLL